MYYHNIIGDSLLCKCSGWVQWNWCLYPHSFVRLSFHLVCVSQHSIETKIDFLHFHNYEVILNYKREASCKLITSQNNKCKFLLFFSFTCFPIFWNDSSSFLAAKSGERLAAICGKYLEGEVLHPRAGGSY